LLPEAEWAADGADKAPAFVERLSLGLIVTVKDVNANEATREDGGISSSSPALHRQMNIKTDK